MNDRSSASSKPWARALPLRGPSALAFLLLALSPCGLCAQAGGLEPDPEALSGVLTALATQAATAEELGLRGDALLAWAKVVVLDPEHAAGRKALKHRKQRDGTWRVPSRPRKARNKKKAEEEHGEAWRATYASTLKTWVDTRLRELAPQRKVEALVPWVSAHEALLELTPEHVGLRAAMGEVRVESGWSLASAVRAPERRAALDAVLAKLREKPPEVRDGSVSGLTEALELEFARTAQAGRITVAATTDAAEAEDTLAALASVDAYVGAVMGKDYGRLPGLIVHLLDPSHRDAFLAHGGLTESKRKRLGGGRLTGGWASNTEFAQWSPKADHRKDASLRQVIANLFFMQHRVPFDNALVHEGLGLLLAHRIGGTRLTWFGRPSEYGRDKELDLKLLRKADADWLTTAAEVLARDADKRPSLASCFGTKVGQLTVEQLVLLNAACTWIVEGHPELLPQLVQMSSRRNANPALHIAYTVGVRPAEIEERLARWLNETRGQR